MVKVLLFPASLFTFVLPPYLSTVPNNVAMRSTSRIWSEVTAGTTMPSSTRKCTIVVASSLFCSRSCFELMAGIVQGSFDGWDAHYQKQSHYGTITEGLTVVFG
jgi:hypothetical protein